MARMGLGVTVPLTRCWVGEKGSFLGGWHIGGRVIANESPPGSSGSIAFSR